MDAIAAQSRTKAMVRDWLARERLCGAVLGSRDVDAKDLAVPGRVGPDDSTSLSIHLVGTASGWQVVTTLVRPASARWRRSSSRSAKWVPARSLEIATAIAPTRVSKERGAGGRCARWSARQTGCRTRRRRSHPPRHPIRASMNMDSRSGSRSGGGVLKLLAQVLAGAILGPAVIACFRSSRLGRSLEE